MAGCGSLAFPAHGPKAASPSTSARVRHRPRSRRSDALSSRVSSVRSRRNPARCAAIPNCPKATRSGTTRRTASKRHRRRTDPRGFPSTDTESCASTPGAATSLARDRTRLHRHTVATRRVLFRPRGFSPPRRLAPRRSLRVCCTPQPVLGFDAFHHRRRHRPEGLRRPRRSPRRIHPPKNSPRRQPYRVTRPMPS